MQVMEDNLTIESFYDSFNLSQKEFSILCSDVKTLINYRDLMRIDLIFTDGDVTEDFRENLLRKSKISHNELVIRYLNSPIYKTLLLAKESFLWLKN